uniref:DUF1345 domain-containing protein n=1 Tax=Altererythrobacter segetis TaxID=1104773 RepID=UPI00140D806C|nr:DUF1345 domain-containing protein [Altererythrobacter segetis]
MTDTSRKARKATTVGNRIAPRRFLLFLAVLIAGYLAYRAAWPATKWSEAAAMAFDAASVIFLGSLMPLLRDNSPESIRQHAARNDANRALILVVTTFLTFVAMTAISGELDSARSGDLAAIVKLVGTLLLIWLFANSVYALHYAHAYYSLSDETGVDTGGIEFPGTKTPAYDDFLYFAFTLGMTFQTSDTNITASGVRRIALLHSFAAFVFSIGVIAFTINVLGGAGG